MARQVALPFKTAWLVGASTGIGRALALALSRAGVTTIISARSADKLAAVAHEAPGPGAIIARPLDVTDRAQVNAAAADVRAAHGPIGCLVYCAAHLEPAKMSAFTAAAFRPAIEVNLMGAVHAIEAVLDDMKARASGRIVLVSSVAGYRGLPRAAAYGASKAALTHLGEALRLSLAPDNITVQVVNPGFVATPLTAKNDFPMPFLMPAEDAAQRILKGLAGSAFEITFPRRFTYFLKLLRILPYGLYFRVLAWATRRHGG